MFPPLPTKTASTVGARPLMPMRVERDGARVVNRERYTVIKEGLSRVKRQIFLIG